MKILRVISSVDPSGGGPMEGARRIDAELVRQGHQLELVCLDAPGQPFLDGYPSIVHALGPASTAYCYSARLFPWLKSNENRFDAVIINGLWQYHGFAVWRAFARTNTPYFVFTHGMLDPWFKHKYPLKHLKKWLYWPWAEYRILRDAKAVLFTSEEERRLARESFWLYKCNEYVTAYGTRQAPSDEDGLLAARFRARHPELEGKQIILFLSRIDKKKGCDLLIEAFSRLSALHPKLHLVIAGPDRSGLASELKTQANRLGIAGRITWPGMLQGDDKWGAFYAAETFCLPSHQENFGIVVAEALACGTPVLITNKVNIWREIEADGAGMAQNDTLEGISKALAQWLALTPKAKQQMRLSARQCFEARFSIDRVAESLINILQKNVTATCTPEASA